jgi:hypothetical protein
MNQLDQLAEQVRRLQQQVAEMDLRIHKSLAFVPCAAIVGSGFNAAAKSTTTYTDLTVSTIWAGVPDNAKAILVRVKVNDSAAWGSGTYFASLGADQLVCACWGGDLPNYGMGIVAVATDTVNWRCNASGADSLDVTFTVYGYWI